MRFLPTILPTDDSTFATREGSDATVSNEWHWWLRAKFQKHRNDVTAVHPLLASLDTEIGHGFMTTEHVLAVLDSPNPAGLVGGWLLARSRSKRAHPTEYRQCAYPECPERVSAANAKYCETHARIRTREAKRAFDRRARKNVHSIDSQSGKSNPPNPTPDAEFVNRLAVGR